MDQLLGSVLSPLGCVISISQTADKGAKVQQEAHGPRFAHLSDIATADMQMFPIIYAKIQP